MLLSPVGAKSNILANITAKTKELNEVITKHILRGFTNKWFLFIDNNNHEMEIKTQQRNANNITIIKDLDIEGSPHILKLNITEGPTISA